MNSAWCYTKRVDKGVIKEEAREGETGNPRLSRIIR